MPRRQRRKSGTEVYHVITRGNNKEKIFEREIDKITFIRILKKATKKYSAMVYAYCIMNNHMHMMVKVSEGNLPKYMQT